MNGEIRIYVAHTPNDHMERVSAPCFFNVLAGSCFQTNTFPEGMLRDDTGDNISDKTASLRYNTGHGRMRRRITMASATTGGSFPLTGKAFLQTTGEWLNLKNLISRSIRSLRCGAFVS